MWFVELIFDPLSNVLKFLGATFLFLLGKVVNFFNPNRKVYSFKEIWNKEFDKGDGYWSFAEEFSQQLIGAIMLGTIAIMFIFKN